MTVKVFEGTMAEGMKITDEPKRCLVLASGGLDSTLVMVKLLKEGYEVWPLFIDYGQYQIDHESLSIERVVEWLQHRNIACSPHDIVDLEIDLNVTQVANSPGRILAFLGLAGMFNTQTGDYFTHVATGYQGITKYEEAKDSTQEILVPIVEKLTGLEYITPLRGMGKDAIGKEIKALGIPWDIMYTCWWSPPCGTRSTRDTYRCGGCEAKTRAMQAAGEKGEILVRPNAF